MSTEKTQCSQLVKENMLIFEHAKSNIFISHFRFSEFVSSCKSSGQFINSRLRYSQFNPFQPSVAFHIETSHLIS